FAMLNERDHGINGVKLTWEKCETEYRNDRGVECYERSKNKGPTGASVIHPLSTGITYSLIEKATADRIPVISLGYGRTDAADRQRAAGTGAAAPPDQARLGDPARLGRHAPDGAESRRQDRLPARQDRRCLVVGRRRGRDPRRRRGEGLYRRRVQPAGHELSG